MEGLRRLIRAAKSRGRLKGASVARKMNLTHLIFVDDVFIFIDGSQREINIIKKIPSLFSKATSMETNLQKSNLSAIGCSEE